MEKLTDTLLGEIAHYYSQKLGQFGDTARGVDWNGSASQQLRFEQLSKIIQQEADLSVNDLGCGYGAFYEYLMTHYPKCDYTGVDVAGDMIEAANRRWASAPGARFVCAAQFQESAAYAVASGIFNVRLGYSDTVWQDYIKATLEELHGSSRFGFAFNCLSTYSDEEHRRDYLFYADPHWLFAYCKQHFSSEVALLHDYGLYEFTVLVRKTP